MLSQDPVEARSEDWEEVTEAPELEREEASEGSDVETREERGGPWGRNFRASSSQLPNLTPPVVSKFFSLRRNVEMRLKLT